MRFKASLRFRVQPLRADAALQQSKRADTPTPDMLKDQNFLIAKT